MISPLVDSFPLALQVVDPAAIVEADVREDLRAGREPFARIMAARATVPAGGCLVVRATFEPAPLYRVMGKQGFLHHTEELAADDWRVWFYTDVTVLDVRDMDPPEPLVHTLAVSETLAEGGALVHVNVRVPQFLLPKLSERGFTYEIREVAPDRVHVVIRRAVAPSSPHPHRTTTMTEARVLDVRAIPPREKHPTIFQTYTALSAGETFILLNDHDPKPLRYQFEAEHAGQFTWEYVEQGPAIWRVAIGKRAA